MKGKNTKKNERSVLTFMIKRRSNFFHMTKKPEAVSIYINLGWHFNFNLLSPTDSKSQQTQIYKHMKRGIGEGSNRDREQKIAGTSNK